ncbi:MAG: 16S rRNA (guanine(966)-N(2))-methyltransferase RsmD [Bryobacteraceae bacterium]|nr:16S rRNA (guanine(966)-N(2))-methyltransferase RsmD [Bryobacteraceae bacterium]
MRVIAGEFRSRQLVAPAGTQTRPTPDRLRESLFSALGDRVEGSVFLDAYAGSGSVGIEALSRGAKRAVFVEKHPQALAALRTNLEKLGIGSRATVINSAAARALRQQVADIVFLDPPYDRPTEYDAALESVGECGLLLVQHSVRQSLPEVCGELARVRQMRQGDNVISFYESEALR